SVSTIGPDKLCEVRLVRTTVKNFPKKEPWQAIASGEAALNIVVWDTAAKIMVDIDKKAQDITKNWRSFALLRQGITLLQIATDDSAKRASLLSLARE